MSTFTDLDPSAQASAPAASAWAARWPLPACCGWGAAWLCWFALGAVPGLPPLLRAAAACVAASPWALAQGTTLRRGLVMGGFPASALALGLAAEGPAWVWMAAALPLMLLYPLRAWRDAPLFPTPAQALEGLDGAVLPAPRHILDAGCGLGHGLLALHRLWPQAQIAGVEWSRPLAWLTAWRCRFARVRAGDMWRQDWSGHDLVYLFQRPESMVRAWEKARAEMRPGSWLVSLEFDIPGVPAHAVLRRPQQRAVWIYRPAGAGPRSGEPMPRTSDSTDAPMGR